MNGFQTQTSDYKLTPISRSRYKIEVFSFKFGKKESQQISRCYFSGNEQAWVMPRSKDCLGQFIKLVREKSEHNKKNDIDSAIQEMQDILRVRRYSESTIKTYIDIIHRYFQFYPDSDPKKLNSDHFKKYIKHLFSTRKVSYSFQKQVISAVKFYYRNILRADTNDYYFEIPKSPEEHLPVVLSKEEVRMIISSVGNLKHRVILMTVYSAGLRLSEVVNLKLADIDKSRMLIYVRGGKGKKDRTTLLSQELLKTLKEYYLEYRPEVWLFEGRNEQKFSKRSVQEIFKKALYKSGVDKSASVHTLRHSFATHLLEDGVDLRFIQKLLGHKNIKTSEIYTHITKQGIKRIRSPLDDLIKE